MPPLEPAHRHNATSRNLLIAKQPTTLAVLASKQPTKLSHSLQTGDLNLVAMKTSEVAFQIYGCSQALDTPVMHWKHLIEVRCRELILRLADFPTSLLQFCHTQKSVCFGGVEPHVRVMPVQTFFDYTEREKFLRDNTELQTYLAELAVVPELLDRACRSLQAS